MYRPSPELRESLSRVGLVDNIMFNIVSSPELRESLSRDELVWKPYV